MPTALEGLLRQAADRLPHPTRAATAEARRAALAAFEEANGRTPAPRPSGSGRLRNGPPLRALAFAAALIVLASVAALALTARGGHAGPEVPASAGPGFLPSPGWTVLTTAPAGPAGAAAAVAANVPLRDEITPSATLPYRTIEELPPDGIVIVASFRPRGEDVGLDAAYPSRDLPFTVVDAGLTWPDAAANDEPVSMFVRGAAAGYNVHVSVHVGGPLTEGLLAEVQEQLNRLVVPPVLLRARQTVATGLGAVWARPAELFGAVGTGEGHDAVLEINECGTGFYRAVGSMHTDEDGRFELEVLPEITTSYRISWGGAVSRPVTVRARPGMTLHHVFGSTYDYSVLAVHDLSGRRVVVQRFEPASRRWIAMQVLTLPEARGNPGGRFATGGRFTARLAPGTPLRVTISDSQTGDCYAAGYSNIVTAP